MVCPLLKSKPVEIFHRHLMALAPVDSLIEQGQFDILHRCLKRDEVERLEDESYHLVTILGGTRLAQVLN